MQIVRDLVARHPGTAILPIARRVGPHGSVQFGYRVVHRAIKAGIIRAERVGARYALHPVSAPAAA